MGRKSCCISFCKQSEVCVYHVFIKTLEEHMLTLANTRLLAQPEKRWLSKKPCQLRTAFVECQRCAASSWPEFLWAYFWAVEQRILGVYTRSYFPDPWHYKRARTPYTACRKVELKIDDTQNQKFNCQTYDVGCPTPIKQLMYTPIPLTHLDDVKTARIHIKDCRLPTVKEMNELNNKNT